ncbi:hypothetical protein HA402_001446 [Bradysia odoriphaga]|nr:hypothetical protein HA402_001446 [Bradysia odoriphaga]
MIISCCICCEFLLPENVLLHLKCGHIFHENCLAEWMKRSKTCPQCRKKTCRPTRIYPNFTNATLDELKDQLVDVEKEQLETTLAAKEVDIVLLNATLKLATEDHNRETLSLRNQIIIFEERIKDLLFEMSAAKLAEKEHLDKLDQCRLELRNAQIDLNGRMKLIECFERVNAQLQTRQTEIEVENNRLREQVRTLLSSASSAMKRKVAMDEFMNQHQNKKKIVIDLDDDDNDNNASDDDDCVIVVNDGVTEKTENMVK